MGTTNAQLKCLCASSCPSGCDAIPADCSDGDCALVTKLKADCSNLNNAYEVEVSRVTATTPSATEVATAVTDVRAESNGVSNVSGDNEDSGLGAGAIVGIVIGCLLVVAL